MVVGAGISGLTAAHVFRKARPDARILVLDNHDDFGGHAKRNEFTHDGRTYIGYGGTQSIDSPAPYSQVAKDLITELGIDVAALPKVLDSACTNHSACAPPRSSTRKPSAPIAWWLATSAMRRFWPRRRFSDAVQRDLGRLLTERSIRCLASPSEKKARLARMSYKDFVTKMWKLDPGVLWPYQTRTHGLFGVGIDAVPAQDAFALGLPGFRGWGSTTSRARARTSTRCAARKRRTTTSTSPTATRRSRGCWCDALVPAPSRAAQWRMS